LVQKLVLNSLYGKLVQRSGGFDGLPPPSACPYYANAITAWGRRRVLEAALVNPSAVVSFMTDGVISEEYLDHGAVGSALGEWEDKSLKDGIFLQSGFYSVLEQDEKDEWKTVLKARGARKDHIRLPGLELTGIGKKNRSALMRQYLIDGVLAQWNKPIDGKTVAEYEKKVRTDPTAWHMAGEFVPQEYWPTLEILQRDFVTAGAAVASEKRMNVIGCWAHDYMRSTHVHALGIKRQFLSPLASWRWTIRLDNGEIVPALRCSELIDTFPSANGTPDVLSAPAYPQWVDPNADDDEALAAKDNGFDEDERSIDEASDRDLAEIEHGL
jgi:hypothetical protein